MKRKNTTRNALFTSIISLLLCVSMLVGTTFAWFTDSVVSGNNVIAAGNLDIELYHDGNKKVDSSTNLFNDVLWEPGVVIYENFTIKNEGNLALLYDFAMNWGDYNTLAGQYNLTQVLKVAKIDGHVSGSREAAIAAGEGKWAALDSWSFSGEMTTKGETKDFALIIYWEPSDNDNNWNVQNGKTLDKGEYLYVNLGINLQATQKMHEEDSFGKDYDSLANPWDGSVGEVPEAEENVITLTTAAELAAFAKAVNEGTTYSGKTVKLGANINLDNQPWTAIGDCESGKYFQGTFDGQGYTIYNLNVDYSTDTSSHATAGLFGWVDAAMATVKNVNIDGTTVKGSHWVGVIAGYFTGRIENCSVNNATVIGNNVNDEANGDKVGGIVGYLNEHSYINNNTVSNSTITGNRDIGGIAGSVAASTIEMKNNKVADTTITYSTSKSYASAGEIVSGRTGYVADSSNTATNVTFVKSVVVSTADELAAALKSTDKDIVITLANNIDVPMSSLGSQTPGSGEYKLGGDSTESIVIDLNGHNLTLTTSYMTAIGAKNADATITIKNGSMNGTGNSATTWNINDLIFANCNYVIENVVFDKEVALENTGKTATLKNVTIKGTGDYYALWISARGQNVEIDGLTINSTGRGIKIDEQYVGTPAKVNLKVSNADINTSKKGAIMVKSSAGADITLSNVNIANTADATNAVWVDEDSKDYFDLVNVTGGEKIYEGNVVANAVVANAAELIAALATGGNVELKNDITISSDLLKTYDSSIVSTPVGMFVSEDTVLNMNGHNIVIADNGTGTATAIFVKDADLTIVGNGTITQEGTDDYLLWAKGASTVTIEGGTFVTNPDDCCVFYASGNTAWDPTDDYATINIYGGTFTSGHSSEAGDNANVMNHGVGRINYYGGTFNWDPSALTGDDAPYIKVAAGYKTVDNGDGTWTVTAE